MQQPPETRYARNGGAHIAYQVFGGPGPDLVWVPGFFSHLDLLWESPAAVRALERLGSFARVILFDRRGSGLSDPVEGAPTLEERMDDVRAVMDAAGSDRATLLGVSEGGSMSILFAAARPDRVASLVLYGALARAVYDDDYTWAPPAQAFIEATDELIAPYWGTGATIEVAAPSLADQPAERAFYARMERSGSSPAMTARLASMFLETDVREAARAIRVPTLVLHRAGDRLVNVRHGRWLAEHIPGATYVELPGPDHSMFVDAAATLDEVQRFVTGARPVAEPDRVLATVLFTDIVGSTQAAVVSGDRRWRERIEDHQRVAGETIAGHGGRVVKWTGDGHLATFDGPARAVRCAHELLSAAERRGLRLRAGIHTGEVERSGSDVAGVGVHIAARVSALAGTGEVLVSRTVRDLVAGSGLRFADHGEHELKGLPERWAVYRALMP